MVWTRLVFVGLLFTLFAGCFGGNGDERPTAPVQVTVKYKDKPVEGATVQFISIEKPQPSVGLTNAQGVCSLTTYRNNDGAIVGGNVITIVKSDIDKTNIKPIKPEDQDLVGVSAIPTLKNLLPAKYAAPGTSGFKEEVKKGSNSFTFDLKD